VSGVHSSFFVVYRQQLKRKKAGEIQGCPDYAGILSFLFCDFLTGD
jgi:hypothetical protein